MVTFERFLGSCKLSILTHVLLRKLIRFSCDLTFGRAATISAGGLTLRYENTVL